MNEDQWGECLRAKEPSVREKAHAWSEMTSLCDSAFPCEKKSITDVERVNKELING